MNPIGRPTLALAVGIASGAVFAAEETAAPPPEPAPVHAFYVFLDLGVYDADGGASYLARSDGGVWFGAGLGWHLAPAVAFETEALFASEDHPIGGSSPWAWGDGRSLVVSTAGLTLNARAGPLLGRFRPFVVGGVGLGTVELADQVGYWPSHAIVSEFALLTRWGAGFDVRVGPHARVGLEYRRIDAHRDLEFAGERLSGSGEAWVFSWRYGYAPRGGRAGPPGA